MTTDLIQIVDCLTEAEISTCLTFLEKVSWQSATVLGPKAELYKLDSTVRNNQGYTIKDTDEINYIVHEAMNRSLLAYRDEISNNICESFGGYPVPGGNWTSCTREAIQALSYTENQFYTWHHDQAFEPSNDFYYRTISVILYLQNAEEGGRTIFHHKAYKPKPGQALIFPSNWCYPHRGEEVIKGRKIALVTWYHSFYDSNP